MANLILQKETAIKIYQSANRDIKMILEESFGKDLFTEKITDRIKTISDIIENVIKWYHSVPDYQLNTKIKKACYLIVAKYLKNPRSLSAEDQIRLIAFVLNEGWEENFLDRDQRKYYPWFERKASGGWAVYFDASVSCYFSYLGFGCYYKSSELALYAANQFLDIYKEYLPE
jgi:hypothetical protein